MKPKNPYFKNLDLFQRDNPVEAYRLEMSDCSRMKFCETYEHERNLIDASQQPPLYMHFQEGAAWEADQWAKKLPLAGIDVVFVYGLGLGYYYLPLKQWLEDPSHSLVFLEDNPCVIRHFLQTELASEMLQNPQVVVKLLPKIEANEAGWSVLRESASSIFHAFARSNPAIFALNAYFVHRFDFFHAFSVQWLAEVSNVKRELVEFYPNTSLIFHNFYANLFHLPEAIPGYSLAGAMQGIPAVLCGAGPSLTKQLPLLKTVSGQIFLMASGSAMNAVTQASLLPHAGGAVDPTSTQASRQLTSFGYEVPAFYKNRFYDEALKQWHGPLLYMTGSGAIRVSEWFETELGLHGLTQIISGVSTSNFLLEIAGLLGCNPIVLVGMDLAYTGEARYAQGIAVHPADDPEQRQTVQRKKGPVLAVPGANGKDVYTNPLWFYEAVCIGAFKERNPQVVCLNATEGGMVIPNVPNVALSEAAETYFTTEWDVQGWFHGAVQNAGKSGVFLEHVRAAVKKWRGSLEACVHCLNRLLDHLKCNPKERSPKGFYPYQGQIVLWREELFTEPAYRFLLDTLNGVFNIIHALRLRKLKWCKRQKDRKKELLAIEMERCRFLLEYVEDHLKSLNEGEKSFREWTSALAKERPGAERPKGPFAPPEYRQHRGTMVLREPSLGVDLETEFCPQMIPKSSWPKPEKQPRVEALIGTLEGKREGQTLYFYSNGKVKAEAFYRRGKLHGPWSFYSSEGVLLYRSWYVEGKKQGKSCAYYSSGALYDVQGFHNGLFQGEQLYYYEDGTLKTAVQYDKGLLHGVIRLYYSNGLLKKEQHFDRGHLHGVERGWSVTGQLVLEASYVEGKPVGIARMWHPDGTLAREVVS